jgi:TfoX/Sxy family transcriptional regulator of competence genes
MAFDESLAQRIRTIFGRRKDVSEKKMFGGIGFLLNGNICVGVWKDSLVARLGADQEKDARRELHVRAFDITGKAMKGWVLVGPEGVADDAGLTGWINQAVAFVRELPAK